MLATNIFISDVLPILVFFVGLGGLVLGIPSFVAARRRRDQAIEDKLALTDEAVSRVMGRRANPDRGEDEVIGLVRIVPELQRRVDLLTEEIGDRAELHDTNLLTLIAEIRDDVARLAREVDAGDD